MSRQHTLYWLPLIVLAPHMLEEYSRFPAWATRHFGATSGVVTLVGSRGRHLTWVVFLAIGVLTWVGHALRSG
ncbi:MAG: hypothetical protein FJX72_09320 [Armatimonadetes bacterium]|nr:hypothetical protein [Armatimonadota bacterium]